MILTAAIWAISAACKARDAQLVGTLLNTLNPARRDSDRYLAEPYVTPGNIDGPESPHFGRGGWTWYTGSAAWLQRVVAEWVLGIRPEWDGLRVAPCLPPDWSDASLRRSYRGANLLIDIKRQSDPAAPVPGVPVPGAPRPIAVTLDGETSLDNFIPAARLTGQHKITVRY